MDEIAKKHTVLITGAAGYVGAMLVHQFSKRDDVEKIIGIDKDETPDLIKDISKLKFIKLNLANSFWQKEIESENPDIVIHCAWQIREIYGNRKKQWQWNITGSDLVFDFALNTKSVKKLIHFSTVASYGALPENSLEKRFSEDDKLRETDYLYAEEKRISEEHLREKVDEIKKDHPDQSLPQIYILRPAAITGPRGRYMKVRFGLQSALSGQLKDSKESFFYRLVSKITKLVPITPKWCRQFVHEDDVNDIVSRLAFDEYQKDFEVFNLCPPGDLVLGKDIAKAVSKKPITLPPLFIRLAFFLAWHLSHGKIPTSRGGWKTYSYPVAVSGEKVTNELGYQYKMNSLDAFTKKEGRYMEFVEVE